MDVNIEVTLKKRIEELKEHRDKFVADANQHIVQVNGGIMELEALLKSLQGGDSTLEVTPGGAI